MMRASPSVLAQLLIGVVLGTLVGVAGRWLSSRQRWIRAIAFGTFAVLIGMAVLALGMPPLTAAMVSLILALLALPALLIPRIGRLPVEREAVAERIEEGTPSMPRYTWIAAAVVSVMGVFLLWPPFRLTHVGIGLALVLTGAGLFLGHGRAWLLGETACVFGLGLGGLFMLGPGARGEGLTLVVPSGVALAALVAPRALHWGSARFRRGGRPH